ncbi:MAG: hypothetical protein AAGB04_00310 [Pseudomonadota bacterium]
MTKTLLTTLSYSAGRQSHRLAMGILRGEISVPEHFLLLAADPGNEHKDTVRIRNQTIERFLAAGYWAMVAPGPQMLDDLRERRLEGRTSIDNAAYWNEGGGRQMQKCTRHYKIRPMRRVIRQFVQRVHGVKVPPPGSVQTWIGFTFDERHRCKPSDVKYEQPHYPLIELGETKQDVLDWYEKTGVELPPPSVCNHCWANGTETFKRISETDQQGWERAKQFDRESRDMTQFGIKRPCYCSRTLASLDDLEKKGFAVGNAADAAELSCDSGMCFI